MTADLRAAAQKALVALEYHTQQTRPIEQTEHAIKALMEVLAAPSPVVKESLTTQAPAEAHGVTDDLCTVARHMAGLPPAITMEDGAVYNLDPGVARAIRHAFILAGSKVQPKGMPQAIQATIGKLLAEAMNAAASNGANSVSMPDEYVQLAVWLASANGQCCERAAGPGQVCDECASVNAAYSADMAPVREAQAPAPAPHPLQAACRYISDVLASDAPAGEKRIAREIMHLLPLVQAPAVGKAIWTDAAIMSLMNRVGDGPYGEEDVRVTRRFMEAAEEIRAELVECQPPVQGNQP